MPIALIESALMIAGLLATAALLWRMFHEQLRGYNSLALYLIWNFAAQFRCSSLTAVRGCTRTSMSL